MKKISLYIALIGIVTLSLAPRYTSAANPGGICTDPSAQNFCINQTTGAGSCFASCPAGWGQSDATGATAPGYVAPASQSGQPVTPAATPAAPAANTNCPGGGTQQTVIINDQSVQGGCSLGYTPLEPIPGVTAGTNGTQLDFPTLLGNIYKIAITIGALFAVLMLTVSGVRYMLSDVVTDKERAKKRITACLYGLVLIAASWLILNTINPQLVRFNLNPGTATVTPGTPTAPQATGAQTQTIQLTAAQQQQFDLANNNVLLVNDSSATQASGQIQQFTSACSGGVVISSISATNFGGNINQTAYTCTTGGGAINTFSPSLPAFPGT